jgi:fucose 4-O-acetylase-like acetyltransferase
MPQDTDIPVKTEVQSTSNPAKANIAWAPRRDASLDIAKGFGILLVVLGHCLIGLKGSNFFSPTLAWPATAIFIIYLFHMPLFFVVSGHLASGKHRPAGTTIAKLIPTIVYPYFLWSILQGLVEIYLSKYTNGHASFTSLYRILWVPIIPYWFLYALFFCHLGYLVIRKLPYAAQLAIAFACFLVPLFFAEALTRAYLIIIMETGRGFLYFILGVVSVSQVKQFGRWAAITATLLFVVFATVCTQSALHGVTGSVAVLPAALAGIVATLAWSRLLATRENFFVGTMAFLGRYSMSIYVMHIFFTAGVRIALQRLHLQPNLTGTVVEIVAATTLGILIPLGFNWVASKMKMDAWFGIQHMETR